MQESGTFHKGLGYWTLTGISLGGIIGSGWLLGSMYAAQVAGPESIVAWIIGGIAILLVALVFVELAIARPESGGLVRWPRYTNGVMVSSIIGWAMWLSYAANPPTEASGILQYASHYIQGIYTGTALTPLGIILAILLMLLFVAINYFGVRIFARANLVITILKFVVPTLTLIMLFLTGFHSGNFTQYGGFAPYGWSPGLSAIATSGVIFAYTGFRASIDLSGEAVNPKRDITRAVITAVIVAIVLYICLELVFVGAVPGNVLAKAGWQGVNFSSPFAQIAMALNLTWLLWLIYADALISPAGSSFVYTASNSRIVYGLAKNRFFPTFFANLHTRFGVPTRALLLNFVVGLLFLIPLKSWHSIISVTGSLGVFTYAAGAVSVIVFRRMNITKQDQRLRGMTIIAPLAFIVASLIIYWAGWSTLSTTIPLLIVGIIVYFISFLTTRSDARGILSGLWIIVYVAGLLVLSYLGSFDGLKVIPAPWDSVVAAVFALLIYIWAVSAGVAYMKQSSDVLSEVELNAEGQAMVTGD